MWIVFSGVQYPHGAAFGDICCCGPLHILVRSKHRSNINCLYSIRAWAYMHGTEDIHIFSVPFNSEPVREFVRYNRVVYLAS